METSDTFGTSKMISYGNRSVLERDERLSRHRMPFLSLYQRAPVRNHHVVLRPVARLEPLAEQIGREANQLRVVVPSAAEGGTCRETLQAVLLASSTYYAVQAFRVGQAAWGVQFHLECDTAMLADWLGNNGKLLVEQGLDGAVLLAYADALADDLSEVWHPFAPRFAQLARGELAPVGPRPGRPLPLLGA